MPPHAIGNPARFAAAHAARSPGWATTDLLLAWHLHGVVGFSGAAISAVLPAARFRVVDPVAVTAIRIAHAVQDVLQNALGCCCPRGTTMQSAMPGCA